MIYHQALRSIEILLVEDSPSDANLSIKGFLQQFLIKRTTKMNPKTKPSIGFSSFSVARLIAIRCKCSNRQQLTLLTTLDN